jgi:hypothetical protein
MAEILLKVALNTINQSTNQPINKIGSGGSPCRLAEEIPL